MVSYMLSARALTITLTLAFSQCFAQEIMKKEGPDCSLKKNKGFAECFCRVPKNWNESICQGPKWFGSPEMRELEPKIVDGERVNPGTYPWFAQFPFPTVCGGSLVTPEYVLTAAHCFDDGNLQSIKQTRNPFRIGALCAPFGPDASSNCGQEVEAFGVSDIFLHPSYVGGTYENDFALVRLDGRSSLTPVQMDEGSVSPGYENLAFKENLWPIGKFSLT